MKKALILGLLFFIFFSTFSQNKTLSRKINWHIPKSVSYYYNINQKGLNQESYFSFDNENYIGENQIPYYFELIPVSASYNSLIISNVNYEILPNDVVKIIKDKNKIPTEISYTQKVNNARGIFYIQLNLFPIRKNPKTGRYEKIISFDIELERSPNKLLQYNQVKEKISNESIFKTGKWVKVKIKNNGIYKITYSELIDMGFTNPENIKLYGNSDGMLPISNIEECQDDPLQNFIYFEKGTDGIFNNGDYILFYAKGPDKWEYNPDNNFYYCTKHIYSEHNYCYLTTNVGSTAHIPTIPTPSGASSETITRFVDYINHEQENRNLLESGQQWFGEKFDVTTNKDFEFEFPNIITTIPIQAEIRVAARSANSSSFTIKSGSQLIATPSLSSVNMSSYTSTYASTNISSGDFSSSSDNITINVNYNKPTSSSEGWLDYITLNATRSLSLVNGLLEFRYYNSDLSNKIVEFKISNANSSTKVWDITNPINAKNLNKSTSGNVITVKVEVQPGVNEFIAFNNTDFAQVEIIGPVNNQNLHAINHRDMIIVTHPDFITQANEIKELHEQEGLSVTVVTPDQIYNEFSSGTVDATAIRNFVKMIYNRPSLTDTLKYLLLIGDGSYDHKSILENNINYIPTYQSVNSLSPTGSFVTDDFFGLLDESDNVELSNSGLVDIGIGRLPVQTSAQAQQMVDKIKIYTNPENKGDWLNKLCFIGDDEDNNLHMRDADRLATFVDTTYPHFFINKIYLDAFPQESASNLESYPEVNRLVNDAVNNGILIFNYTGHGGEDGLAHERILSIDDINSWVNNTQLAVFMTATCEFSRFDNHRYTSAGEHVILNPNGGSIALFTTTRLVYSSPNYTLNRNFYDYVFVKDYKGNTRALGDIIRLAKNVSGTGNNKRNFTLLGDPALKMPLPELNIITDSINHNDVSIYTDTLKALSKVTIHGHIENSLKTKVTNYNGIVYPMVLDKEKNITTLANDGGTPMDFQAQNSILYKGKASVINGDFNYTFVVPKDISYNFDNGKISYYSVSSNTDAKGVFKDFIIGGSNNNAAIDNTGPGINLYMNDENFVSGGVTDENPKLYAVLIDSSGINTVGNGIGHDITAILDNNSSNLILLNDYYESDINDYQKGKIEYLFSELENGEHNLKVKVWDVYNNSSEQDLEFIVAESEKLVIKNIFNYPNPFTENTAFYFDHNKPNQDLEVMIQIFTISGKLVKTITGIINSNSFRSDAINWDGYDDYGDKIGRGVYIYQIKVRTTDGESVKEIEKLVILK